MTIAPFHHSWQIKIVSDLVCLFICNFTMWEEHSWCTILASPSASIPECKHWLDWSCKLMSSLQTIQLNKYPLELLRCPDPQVRPAGQHTWRGNDHMILGYMHSHMQVLETQFITHCGTSAKAYSILHLRHEKHSGLTQIQLIQQMMQIHFDNNPNAFDTTMSQHCKMIYRAEQIGQVNISKLVILFILMHLKGTHPSVYEALSPALMDSTVTLETFEHRMHHFYKSLATHNPDNLAFPSLLPTDSTFANYELSSHFSQSSPTLALPALSPPQANICPNCKSSGTQLSSAFPQEEKCTASRLLTWLLHNRQFVKWRVLAQTPWHSF